jgi:hypothetical protein
VSFNSFLVWPLQAWHCLEQLHVGGGGENVGSKERLHLINTMINLSAVQQVSSFVSCLVFREQSVFQVFAGGRAISAK